MFYYRINPKSAHSKVITMSGNGGELLLLDSNTSNPSCSTAPSQAPQSSGSARPRHSKHSSNGGTPRQTQTFQQLVGMLEALISQKEEAMGGGGKRFEQIQAIFKQLKQIFLAEESQSKRYSSSFILFSFNPKCNMPFKFLKMVWEIACDHNQLLIHCPLIASSPPHPSNFQIKI